MKCAWKALLDILPSRLRQETDPFRDRANNIRLVLGSPPEIVAGEESHFLRGNVTADELHFVINAASRYSPWASATVSQGYITGPGGHRIGICGEAVIRDGRMDGIRRPTALCIRIARDFPGLAEPVAGLPGSILILGAPGWGKTTLLRDLIRQKRRKGCQVCIVDERGELFPEGIDLSSGISVLTGCPKAQGIELMLRTMGPQIIAVDEITAKEDCEALQQAAWCGVNLMATAHAGSLRDFLHRSVYEPLVKQNLFDHLIILHPDRHWHLERSGTWTTNGSGRH